MKELVFLDSALKEIEAAQAYYLEISPALAKHFRDCLLQRLREIQGHPKSCRKVSNTSRRANLSDFPYAIFYEEQRTLILIQALLHQASQKSQL